MWREILADPLNEHTNNTDVIDKENWISDILKRYIITYWERFGWI